MIFNEPQNSRRNMVNGGQTSAALDTVANNLLTVISAKVRHLLEQVTGRFIFRRRLPLECGNGILYVTSAAGLRYICRPMASIDPPLLWSAHRLVRPGDVIWDIGANIGLFSVAAAVRSGDRGKVIAFEPDVWLVQLLRRTSGVQPVANARISVIAAAVASENSLRAFSIAARARASNALAEYGGTQMGGVEDLHTVATFNLDWLLTKLPAPNVIKIDVEGAELEVLRGQTLMLNKVRPVIICEVGSEAAEEVTGVFTLASYRLFEGSKPLDHMRNITCACWNTVAIPDEKVNDYIAAASCDE
jgi:FkbM family methyltransferase